MKKSLNDYIIKMNVLLKSRPTSKYKSLFVNKLGELATRLAAMK